MIGVREYGEKYPVRLELEKGRLAVVAVNEAGHNCTSVDLLDILYWVKKYQPSLWTRAEELCPHCGASPGFTHRSGVFVPGCEHDQPDRFAA